MSESLLKDYLSQNTILIVDTVSSARVNLASNLAKMGGNRSKMLLVGSIKEAQREIQAHKPKIIFSDFMIGQESGFDLIQEQRANYEKESIKDSIFVLVTANVNQSTVARAAEEDVDTFIIKPYTLDTLKKVLAQTVALKLNPSRYLQLIEQGKEKLFASQYIDAIKIFEEARKEHPEPTLACFYSGQAEFMMQAMNDAEKKYQEGLSYNNIHYKCLVGLYDLLMLQKKYHEAYSIIRKIAQYFPANPSRFSSVLRLAVMTENFQDVDDYYKIYVQLGSRPEEIVNYMCSALVVAGKYFLQKSNRERAISSFDQAAVSAAGKTKFYLYIIENLVDFNMVDEADRYLSRLAKISPSCPEYVASRFLITTISGDVKSSVQAGREVLRAGIEFPSVYLKLIEQSILAGYADSVEALAQKASQLWPERAKEFEDATKRAAS